MKLPSKKIRLIVLCALALVIVAAVIVLIKTGNSDDNRIEPNVKTAEANVVVEASSQEVVKEKGELLTAIFLSQEGLVFDEKITYKGETIVPPNVKHTPEGYVFTGWDKDTANMQEDITVRGQYEEVKDKNNVFALTTVYTQDDTALEMPLQLCGQVDMCAFDLQIQYDAEKLEFIDFIDLDSGVVANCDAEAGLVLMNFVQASDIEGGFDICKLSFKPKVNENDVLKVSFKLVEVIEVTDENELAAAESSIVDGLIYVYMKEVS